MTSGRDGGERGAATAATLAAVAVLVAILATAGYVVWRGFLREPERSVSAMGLAYTSHDWDGFERHVDTSAVVDAGIEEFVPEELREGEGLLGLLGQGIIESQKPAVVDLVDERLRQAVESGDAEDGWLREQRGRLAPLRSEVLERSEDEARVRIDAGGRLGEVEVLMVPRGDRWVVVEVLNLRELLGLAAP